MYSYSWDADTGGILLNSSPLAFSKEPRPVYFQELNILGFNQYWNYAENDKYPYLWAEANNYFYRGRLVAKTRGGSLYTKPEILFLEEPEPDGMPLQSVNIPKMIDKNQNIIEKLADDTIKKIYNTYVEYKNRIDIFYVAFSGGKDSAVVLDLVQRSLPHNEFMVLFGDTGMEFPDTYEIIRKTEAYCLENDIRFLEAKSPLSTNDSWNMFGPPAVTNRWCCSVHKTSPQVRLLQRLTQKQGFSGMAFTGVRADESITRSEYDDVNFGEKHRGQYSCHPIIEWNSAELFLYIYYKQLFLNEAYLKGNSRVGCLMCPMSSGKHEYMKQQCYSEEMNKYVDKIKKTSGKIEYTESEMADFIDEGYWKTRKSGRELNFGQDKHVIESNKFNTVITVFCKNPLWKEWAKTIGQMTKVDEKNYTIEYRDKLYQINHEYNGKGKSIFTLTNCGTGKNDIKFISLFRGVIIKSIYCVKCGVCAANCPMGCIEMSNTLLISENCCHCQQCHDIYESCLRYNSIRNRIGGEQGMQKSLDRYFSFGIKKSWLDLYFKDNGSTEFWITDGHSEVPSKKKDAFLNFLKDSGMVEFDKSVSGDKYAKYVPSQFAKVLFSLGSDSEITWALMLCNLVYTPEFNWYVKNIPMNEIITPDQFKFMLENVTENDTKGLGRRNINDAFKIFFVKTPFGTQIGLGNADYEEKVNSSGKEIITLKSFVRGTWENAESRVILYSLFKFAEACGGYYQFTLSRLLKHEIDSDGVSPTEIFGLNRDQMEKILTGLSINFSDYINASFTLDLDNITLSSEKTSADVLQLF